VTGPVSGVSGPGRSPVLGEHGTLPQGEHKRRSVEEMFDRVAPDYDRMNRVISLGFDRRWRRRTIHSLGLGAGGLGTGARVLDVACGTGDLCRELATHGYEPTGIDSSAGMLAAARTHAPLVRGDGERLPFPDGRFDGLVCGFALRNFVRLDAVLRECARVLRTGGRVAYLDAAVPEHAVLRAGNAIWFRGAVPLLGRVLSRDPEAYRYLPRSTAYLPPTPELLDRLRAAGFGAVQRHTMTGGSVQLLVGTRT
jgi:demethylmenaquinone methyltransferase/2-methoxy-6-polyprenyl-1,4-benzoquinol methylase